MPSSLTTLLPSACGFSPHLPVSVYGTGTSNTIAAFLGSVDSETSLLFFSPHHTSSDSGGFAYHPRLRLSRTLPFARFDYLPVSLLHLNVCRWYWNIYQLVIIYAFGLDLVPDLPWADEPSPGNLRLSTERFLASLSLLMPAFSLVYSPPPLPLWLLPVYIAPLPIPIQVFPSFGVRF